MANIYNFYSTPDQGLKLQELVPEIESLYVWFKSTEPTLRTDLAIPKNHKSAYMLQELRDIARLKDLYRRFRMMGADRIESWFDVVTAMTAPELADWIIERLKEQK